jgi:hypothetical protein
MNWLCLRLQVEHNKETNVQVSLDKHIFSRWDL